MQCRRPRFYFSVRKIHWRRDSLPTPVFLGFPCGSAGKESICNAGDLCSVPGLGRSPGDGEGYPLQYSDLENSMDCVVQGHKKSDTTERLSFSPTPRLRTAMGPWPVRNWAIQQEVNGGRAASPAMPHCSPSLTLPPEPSPHCSHYCLNHPHPCLWKNCLP